jgi:hypothetical protein
VRTLGGRHSGYGKEMARTAVKRLKKLLAMRHGAVLSREGRAVLIAMW